MASRIVVVGAANMDLVSYVPRLPRPGETLHGERFEMGFGGKGANQAVMAARLGSQVSLVTKLGRDVFGERTLANLEDNGVDLAHVHTTGEASTGVAPIAVEPDGTNAIIIVTGANDLLTIDEIAAARPVIARAAAVVCQLEIPLELTLAALRRAREDGVRTILTPAPAQEGLPTELLRLTDVLCPNEAEAELLTGRPVGTAEQAREQAEELRARGAGAVVLTLGERGCLVVDDDGSGEVAGVAVQAVDTTGAGDAFVGSLAHFLARGDDLRAAAQRANQVAAVTVGRRGTQASFPYPEELPAGVREA